MAAPTEDVNTALIAQLLGAAPDEDQIQELRDTKAGALTKVQTAYKKPSTPEGYSPFQDMVANYVKTMTPGWSQMGLGAAVAAPYFRDMEEAKTQRLGGIEAAKGELGDAQKDLTNELLLARTGMTAGASLARKANALHGSGGVGKIIANSRHPETNEPGSWLVKPDGTQQWFAGMDNEITKTLRANMTIFGAEGRQDAEAMQKALDATIAQLSGVGRGPGIKPLKPATPAPTEPPLDQLSGPGVTAPEEPTAPPQAGIDYSKLPAGIQRTVQAILDRSDANQDPELARTGMAKIQSLIAPYGKIMMTPDQKIQGSDETRDAAAARIKVDEIADIERRQRMGESSPRDTEDLASLKREAAVTRKPGLPEPKIHDYAGIEAQKSWGKNAIEERKLLGETSIKAGEFDATADLLAKLIARPDVPEGVLGEVINSGRSGLKSLGFHVDESTQAAADMVNAIATTQALQQRTANGQNLMPGALVTYEEKMLKLMAPGLSISKGGSLALLDFIKAMNASHRRIAEEANKMADAAPNKILPMSWETKKHELGEREKLRLQVAVNRIMKKHNLNIQE